MAKSRSLSWRLGVSTLVIVLPLAVFALIMVGWIARNEREAEQNQLIGDAYAFADTVGRHLNAYFLLSAALSHSRLLQHGDLPGFAEQARDTLAEAPGVKVIVSTADGDPVLSIPPSPLDSPVLRDRAALVRRAIESGAAFLSDVNADPALAEANASIETPVFLDGKPVYEIGMLLPLKQFRDLIQRQNFPPNWLSGIVDHKGAFVARIPSEPGRPGTLASAEFRDATRSLPESTVTHNSIGGQKVVSAYAPVEGGWTVGLAADARALGIGPSAFLLTSLLAGLAMLGSLLLSYLNGRALTRRVRDLESKTKNVLTGVPIAATPTGVREFDSLSDTLAKTSELLALRTEQHRHTEEELRSREEHFRLLADSLPQLVWTAGPDGRIDYTNARRERYGAIGQTDWEGIIHPDDRRATAEAWLRASEAAIPYEMEHRLFAIGKGYTWHLSRASPLLDAHGAVVRWYGTTTDIDDQKHREGNVRDLMAEVNHRSRNLLAVAQAIARCGVANAETVHEFQERYSERLLGLAASQDLLTDRNWRGVPLEALVRAQTARCRERRFMSSGPPVLLSPNATQTLGLALRELCDNALKHGAFSNAEGEVSLVWRIDNSEAEPRLEMIWRERGGARVNPAPTSGFGKVVIERLTAAGLNASSTLSFEPDGVIWRLIAPLKDIAKTGASDPLSPGASGEAGSE
ncbi:MAG TPA: HWE histidine kinase domain-containing protein [Roseiarcus sp.]|nr:HWE histidine kinase domain-containing protein [Roseiarcus sp.]